MDESSEVVAVVVLVVIGAMFVLIKILPEDCCNCMMGDTGNERIIDRNFDAENGNGLCVEADNTSFEGSLEDSNNID
jgi:hypothetical protein